MVVRTVHGEAFCKMLLRETKDSYLFGSVNIQHQPFPLEKAELVWIYPVKQAVVNT